jgi:hypothetical protein
VRVQLLLALLAPAGLALCAAPVVFHVSPQGSDTAETGPFASLERARDAVRALKRSQGGTLRQPVHIEVQGGTYTLSRPLRFTPEDSGTAECPVTYAAAPGERPLISGGRTISGWKEETVDGRKLWVAGIPAVREGKWYFRQLWAAGQRRQLARAPNDGFFRMAGVPDLDFANDYRVGQGRFEYAPGDMRKFENLSDAEVVVLHFWVSTRQPIAEVDESKRIATLGQSATFRLTDGGGKNAKFARYYVENALELLDAPGEWYLNRKTGRIYYMPLPGESLDGFEATAPALEQLLLLEGDPRAGRFVEHLVFRGLAFEHAEWWLPASDPKGKFQQQGSTYVPGAIQAYGARHCVLDRCVVAHASNYGIHFSRGCSDNRVEASEIFDLGGGGVKIGESDRSGMVEPDANGIVHDQPAEETHSITITGNHLHDLGRIFHQSLGIFVSQSYNNRIAHNHVHDLYKNAISVGWTWGFGKSLARDNVVEWNHIHDVGKNWFSDGGAIYTLGTQPGTVIRYNLIHDIRSVVYGGHGIYLDEGSSQILVEKNIAYGTSGPAFFQNYGKQNIVRNNVFALSDSAPIQPNGNMAKMPKGVNSFVFERNIVYWELGDSAVRRQWNDTLVEMRRNLYWRVGGGEVKMGPESWTDWRARGMDEGSAVADPLFVDLARRDFRLKPGSPAIQLGFEPIDLSAVGPQVK